MKCPQCRDQNLSISERAGIEIDYCPECRGVWLDRGELDKILERSREPQTLSQPQQDYHRPNPSQAGHYQKPYKGKKSLLEELFD